MHVTVLLFASLREIVGEARLDLELDAQSRLADLEARLVEEFPAVSQVPFVFAVNRDYAKPDRELADGDEVALIPAISGGAPLPEFAFSREALDPRALEAEARSDRDGAIVTFSGVTRDHHGGKAVTGLSYEAYEEMASGKVAEILADVRGALEVGRVLVRHRLGDVPIGEASIVVVAAAAHRDAAFTAARRVMDRIKNEAPIFKKEHYGDRASKWVGDLPSK